MNPMPREFRIQYSEIYNAVENAVESKYVRVAFGAK
jgi:hypothetical protein